MAGFEPDLAFYGNFIEEAATRGDLRAAERWLQNAKTAKVDVDGALYGCLCLAAERSGDLEKAAIYGAKAADLGAELEEALLQRLLASAVEQKRLELVEVFFSLSENISSQSYESVLLACAATRNLPAAERWLSRGEPETVSLPVVVALMDAAASQGNLTMAESFFHWKDGHGGHEMASFNILIKAAGEARLPEAAEYWYFQAKAKNLSANIITYTSLSTTSVVSPY